MGLQSAVPHQDRGSVTLSTVAAEGELTEANSRGHRYAAVVGSDPPPSGALMGSAREIPGSDR